MFSIEIINHILSFRPTHPVGLLVRNNVRELLEDYNGYEFEELKDEFGEEEYDIILYECQIINLNQVSLYRKRLLWDKEECEDDIDYYSNNTSTDIDPIDYDYIDDCKNRIIIINKLLNIFKDIDFGYKYNVKWDIGFDIVGINTANIEEYIITKSFIINK